MFPSGSDNGNMFGSDGPFSGGGFGDIPPSDGMFGDMDPGMEGELFGLEPIDLDVATHQDQVVDVGLHFHGAMRQIRK